MQTINEINTTTEEGRLLLAALSIITTAPGWTNKTPDEVLRIAEETATIMFQPETINKPSIVATTCNCEECQHINPAPPEINKPINYNDLIHGSDAAAAKVQELVRQGSACVVAERVHNGHMFIGWYVHNYDEQPNIFGNDSVE